MASDPLLTDRAKDQGSSRIETQIHRRKKAKAFSALEPEWDPVDQMPPSHLRMLPERMSPTPPNKERKPA